MTEDEARRSQRRALQREHRRRRRNLLLGVAGTLLAIILVVLAPWGGGEEPLTDAAEGAKSGPTGAEKRALREQAAIEKVRAYTNYVREGRPRKPQVALTFDDGPGPYTNQILDVLDDYDAKATFFVLGGMLDEFERVARRELRMGHAIGSHTFGHPRMGSLPLVDQVAELDQQALAFREHGLEQPALFRPPHGSFDSSTLSLLDSRELLMILWSTDTGDYQGASAASIAARALEGARPGAIILMHDAGGDRSQTVSALPVILDGLEQRGLEAVTLPKLLEGNPPPRSQAPPVRLDLAAPAPVG